jgi:hypothetical protein
MTHRLHHVAYRAGWLRGPMRVRYRATSAVAYPILPLAYPSLSAAECRPAAREGSHPSTAAARRGNRSRSGGCSSTRLPLAKKSSRSGRRIPKQFRHSAPPQPRPHSRTPPRTRSGNSVSGTGCRRRRPMHRRLHAHKHGRVGSKRMDVSICTHRCVRTRPCLHVQLYVVMQTQPGTAAADASSCGGWITI